MNPTPKTTPMSVELGFPCPFKDAAPPPLPATPVLAAAAALAPPENEAVAPTSQQSSIGTTRALPPARGRTNTSGGSARGRLRRVSPYSLTPISDRGAPSPSSRCDSLVTLAGDPGSSDALSPSAAMTNTCVVRPFASATSRPAAADEHAAAPHTRAASFSAPPARGRGSAQRHHARADPPQRLGEAPVDAPPSPTTTTSTHPAATAPVPPEAAGSAPPTSPADDDEVDDQTGLETAGAKTSPSPPGPTPVGKRPQARRNYTKLFVGQVPSTLNAKQWLADLFAPYGIRDIHVHHDKGRTSAFLWCGSRHKAARAVKALHGYQYTNGGQSYSLCVEPSTSS